MEELVRAWLKEVYGEDVPSFEVNPTTVHTLYVIASELKERSRTSKVVCEYSKQKTSLYRSESDRVNEVTSRAGFCFDELTQRGKDTVRGLAALGNVLKVSDPSQSTLLCALKQLDRRSRATTTAAGAGNVDSMDQLTTNKTKTALRQLHAARSLRDSLLAEQLVDKEKLDSIESQRDMWHRKQQQYKEEAVLLTAKTRAWGLTEEVTHSSLEMLAKRTSEKRLALQELEKQLEAFHGLPPDASLARAHVNKGLVELRALQLRFDESIVKHMQSSY